MFVGLDPPDEVADGDRVEEQKNELWPAKFPDQMIKLPGNKGTIDHHHKPFGPIFFQDKANAFHEKDDGVGDGDEAEKIESLSIHGRCLLKQHLDIMIAKINIPPLNPAP